MISPDDSGHLELKIAFLGQGNQELSDVVYRQQREIDALRGGLAELPNRLDSFKNSAPTGSPAEERPPHY